MADNIILTGSLLKYRSWLRWSSKNFILTPEALSYSSSSGSEGYIHLKNILVQNGSGTAFNIVNKATNFPTYYLKAPTLEEKTQWINAINKQISNIVYAGHLKKWTNVIKGWQQRYVILFNDRLCYYLSEASGSMRRGTIHLLNRNLTVTRSGTKFGFDVISVDTRTTWYLKGSSDEEVFTWISKINNRKLLHIATGEDAGTLSGVHTTGSTWSLNSAGSKTEVEVESPRVVPSAPPLSNTSSIISEDSDQESNYRKDLECTICLELLFEPTTLTCGHSFCRDCLANLWAADRARFSCPSCRRVIHSVPSVNIALQNLIPALCDGESSEVERESSSNRLAFDNFFADGNGSSRSTAGERTQTHTHTNIEYEFLKRGMFLIFILWVGSKILSPFIGAGVNQPENISKQSEGSFENNDNSSSYASLDSRSTIIFLLVGAFQCPRFLGAYVILFWYGSLVYPSLKIISAMLNQTLGFGLQLKVMLWGSVVPQIWLVPLFLHEDQFVLALMSLVISGVECWEMFFLFRQLFHMNREREQYIVSAIKRESGISFMRLLFARAVSLLPWGWLPDVLYYSALLLITGEIMSKYIARVRGLVERTRALGSISTQIPGVQIRDVLVQRETDEQ